MQFPHLLPGAFFQVALLNFCVLFQCGIEIEFFFFSLVLFSGRNFFIGEQIVAISFFFFFLICARTDFVE